MPKATIESIPKPQGELIRLSLDQIILDPITDVRLSAQRQKEEDQLIDELARTMYDKGQLQPVLVRRNGKDGKYLLIAGRRRYAAAQFIEAKTNEPFPLNALLVDKGDGDAWFAAITENIQRKNFSPIEFAKICVQVRERQGYKGADWSDHVANFLGVSRATVTQHLKLLDLPKTIQDKLSRGELSAQSALELNAVEPAKQEAVLAKAEEKAQEEAEQKARKAATGREGGSKTSSPGSATQPTPQFASKSTKANEVAKADSDAEKGEKGRIKHKHILAAAREIEAVAKPRTRGELLAFWQEVAEAANAYPEPVAEFAKFYVGKWATGEGSDRQLRNRLNVIAELCENKKAKRGGRAA